MTFNDLMAYAVSTNCSDVHITAGTNLAVRRNGVLEILPDVPSIEEASDMIYTILTPEQCEKVAIGGDLDLGHMLSDGTRIRVNIYHQRNNLAASIRVLNNKILSFDELGLPAILRDLAELPRGLVLVTGPTGSGKSTTLAAMVDYINHTAAKHILTIEDPIEYVYPHDYAMIHQREVGKDVDSFTTALRSSLREDPDIILVGEMRDFETINAAITAAETGHLVLSTLHTASAAQTVERILDSCPGEAQNQLRTQLANVIKGVVSQNLVPTADGEGRVVATEIMICNSAISNLIRENKAVQIPSVLQSSKREGMHTLNDDLIRLIHSDVITRAEAIKFSNDPSALSNVM